MTGAALSNLTLYTNLAVRALMQEVQTLLASQRGGGAPAEAAAAAPAQAASEARGAPAAAVADAIPPPPPMVAPEVEGRAERTRMRDARLARFGA